MKWIAICTILCLLYHESHQLKLAAYYQDNMVLQRSPHRAIIWGYASLDSSISLNLFGKTYSTKAKQSSELRTPTWEIILDPTTYKYSVDFEISETDTSGIISKVTLKNVLFGDVWLCSGQSNMQISLTGTLEGENEINNAYKYQDKLRLFTVETLASDKLEYDLLRIKQNWSIPSASNVGDPNKWQYFSAVCWHFGKSLVEQIDYPIGLLVSAYGGTQIERWNEQEVLTKCNVKNNNSIDSILWNSMIHPLLKFPIYGAIWFKVYKIIFSILGSI
jgi:sialate O-acetylesterase